MSNTESTESNIRVLHCTKCKTFTRHTFVQHRVVSAMTIEDLYRCVCGLERRFGLSAVLS